MDLIKKGIVIIGIFLVFILSENVFGIKVVKQFELSFDIAKQFFVLDGKICVWDEGKMVVYSGKNIALSKKIFNRGEGPGDCLIIQNIYYYNNRYYFWDRQLKRLSTFSNKWALLKSERKNNLSLFSAFLGITYDRALFKWSKMEGANGNALFTTHIGFVNKKKKSSVIKFSGVFAKERVENYDRPYIIYSYDNDKLYYTYNQEYKIYSINFNNKKLSPSVYIKRTPKKKKWVDALQNLKYQIIKKPQKLRKKNYPSYIPPVFAIAVHEKVLVVATNNKILNGKTEIDFFSNGKFIGSTDIPILYKQYFIFPSMFNFPPDMYVHKNMLYTFHYFPDADKYKIIQWKINF
jgi:hypothetical protein